MKRKSEQREWNGREGHERKREDTMEDKKRDETVFPSMDSKNWSSFPLTTRRLIHLFFKFFERMCNREGIKV